MIAYSLAFLLVPVLALAVVPFATAKAPSSARGGFSNDITPTSVTSAGGNSFISFSFVETLTGTFAGTRVGIGILEIHSDGTLNARDSGTFTGTIDGSAGTMTITVEAAGTFASLTARFVLTDGAGGLVGVHGEGTVSGAATGPASFGGSYAGQFAFSMDG